MDDLEPIAGYPNKRSMLEALYVEEGLSIKQLASRLRVGTATVERWLRLLGVPKRGRGGCNNSAKVGWALHRIDPRVVFCLSLRELAGMVQASESRCYKYRKGVEAIWNSALSHQPQGLSGMQS